jgi:hypothetical protein
MWKHPLQLDINHFQSRPQKRVSIVLHDRRAEGNSGISMVRVDYELFNGRSSMLSCFLRVFFLS